MKVGDLVMYCDGFTDPEPLLVIEIYDLRSVAVVLNELGEHVVDIDHLVTMSDWNE